MRSIKTLCCAFAIAAFAVPSAHADGWNKKTFLTFSQPVQVPGTTLPAGTYMFKLADLETNRHVVQIYDKAGNKLIAQFLTVPDYKLDPPNDSVVMFQERPRKMARAIKAWWYVGDSTGDEFVYPKTQAFKIAKATHEPVLSSGDDSAGTATKKGTKVGRVGENGEMTADNGPASASRPAANSPSQGSTRTMARNDSTSPTVGTTGSTSANASEHTMNNATRKHARTELPRTASSLTLFELLAAASLFGAFGVGQLRKRSADTL